jgi:hypothetical protein
VHIFGSADETIGVGAPELPEPPASTKDMHISGAELQYISSTGVTIGNGVGGTVTVNAVSYDHSQNIDDVVSLVANLNEKQVLFETADSTFYGLAAQADNGVQVQVDLTTRDSNAAATSAGINMDGDSENASDPDNKVTVADGKTLKGASIITLQSTTGSILASGAMTLAAENGIVIHDTFTGSSSTSKPIVMNADYDSDGSTEKEDGVLTIQASKILTSGNNVVIITAFDVDIDGSITTGTVGASIHGSVNAQTVGLGVAPVVDGAGTPAQTKLELDGNELQRITTAGGLQLGSGRSGSMFVTGVTAANSAYVGTMELDATRASAAVTFKTTATTFTNGIIVRATAGVILSESVTTGTTPTAVSAGTSLTIESTKSLVSTNQVLVVTALDLVLGGTSPGAMSSGTAAMSIHGGTASQTIGLGGTAKDMHITAAELTLVSATGLTVGNGVNGNIYVDAVTEASSDNVGATFTLLASRDDAQIHFITGDSTFNKLAAQADNGVFVEASVNTDTTTMDFNGDVDDSADSADGVHVKNGITATSTTLITLISTNGNIEPAGDATFASGTGITLTDSLTGNGGHLVFDAAVAPATLGTLTVASTMTLSSTDGDITITAVDIDMAGNMDSGTATIAIHGAKDTQTIGLGAAAQMHITDGELGKITASGGLSIGNGDNGSITVTGLTDANTDTVATMTLVATKSEMTVTFTGSRSTFKGLTVQTAHGVNVAAGVTTTTLASTLNAGSGTLTIASTKTVDSTNSKLTITADVLTLTGRILTGTNSAAIETSTAKTIGVGYATQQLDINPLSQADTPWTSQGLIIGGVTSSGITVQGINPTTLTGVVTLLAAKDDQRITLNTGAMTFPALSAQADNGIDIHVSVTASAGNAYFDADYDDLDTDDSDNNFSITSSKTVTAAASNNVAILTLEDTTGVMNQAVLEHF